VYQLPASSIVKDAVAAAGGATVDADLERINLAQVLQDQQQVHVPRIGVLAVQPTGEDGATALVTPPERININTATADDLVTLPGIGPSLAQRIIAWRNEHGPFVRIDDIKQVPGIGETIFTRIQSHITVGP